MKPIKRYDLKYTTDFGHMLEENKKGNWVKHSDMMERVKAFKRDLIMSRGLIINIDKYFPEEDDDG